MTVDEKDLFGVVEHRQEIKEAIKCIEAPVKRVVSQRVDVCRFDNGLRIND